MALINCPNCNKEVSDKAKVCVECGYQLIDDVSTEKMVNCPECGASTEGMEGICSNCGYPLNTVEIKIDEKKKPKSIFKKKWFWVLSVFLMLIISAVSFLLSYIKAEIYYTDFTTAVNEIMVVSAEVEGVANQVSSVWHNAIFNPHNKDTEKFTGNANDFNEALANLFADEEFSGKVASIIEKNNTIDTYIAKLKNPPRKFDDAFDEFKDFYHNYSEYMNFVLSVKGSYETYTQEIYKKSETLMESFTELKLELLG